MMLSTSSSPPTISHEQLINTINNEGSIGQSRQRVVGGLEVQSFGPLINQRPQACPLTAQLEDQRSEQETAGNAREQDGEGHVVAPETSSVTRSDGVDGPAIVHIHRRCSVAS